MANGTDPEKELTPSQKRKAIRKSNKLEAYKRKSGEKEAKMQNSVNKAMDPNHSLIGSAKDKIKSAASAVKSAASTIKTDLKSLDKSKVKADLRNAFPKVSKAVDDAKSLTKSKVADDLRSAFAPRTSVDRSQMSDPNAANLTTKSKLGDKKIITKYTDKNKLEVKKVKEKTKVSTKRTHGPIMGMQYKEDYDPNSTQPTRRAGTGTVSTKVSVKSPYADEGVEGFRNKRTRYRKTHDIESIGDKMVVPVMAGFAGGIGQAIIKYKKDPSGSIL
jgi:hypothetical protein